MNISIDVTQLPLETARLRLRAWRESDLNDFYAYASVPGVGEMAGWPHHESPETTRAVMQSFLEEKNVYAIVEKDSGRVIGSLGLHGSWASHDERFQNLRAVEMGYVLSKDFWGCGLMPEAVRAVIDMLWQNDLVDIITVCHFEENAQSRRVIEKCGFTYMQNGNFFANALNVTFSERQYILFPASR